MAWREVRRQHKLVFRYEPELELIEVMVRGKLEVIKLEEYRPVAARLKRDMIGVDFGRIDKLGEGEA